MFGSELDTLDEDSIIHATKTSCALISASLCLVTPSLLTWGLLARSEHRISFWSTAWVDVGVLLTTYLLGYARRGNRAASWCSIACYVAFTGSTLYGHMNEREFNGFDLCCRIPFLTLLPVGLCVPLCDLVYLGTALANDARRSEKLFSAEGQRLLLRGVVQLVFAYLLFLVALAATVESYQCWFLSFIVCCATVTAYVSVFVLLYPVNFDIGDFETQTFARGGSLLAGATCTCIAFATILEHISNRAPLYRYMAELGAEVLLFATSFDKLVDNWRIRFLGLNILN